MPKQRFELTRSRAVNGGLVAAVLGAGLLVVAAYVKTGVPALLLNNFGAVILSIGLITVIYEARMRSSFTSELLEIVDLRQSLLDAGVKQVCHESDIAWKEVLEPASSFSLILIDAGAWVERDWNHVLSAGRKRPIKVEAFLPDPEGPALQSLSEHLGLDPNDLKSSIERLRQLMEDGWKNAKSSENPLQPNCSIEITYHSQFPSYSLVMANEETIAILHGALGRTAGDESVALRFGQGSADFPAKWFRDQVGRLRNRKLVPVYSDVSPKGKS